MYPLKFKKNLIKKIWGGRALKEVLNINLPDNDTYGESWEVSSHKNAMSYVENGEFSNKSLQELIETYKEKLVGKEIYKKYGNNFPILIKFLDINDKLSVQVHPEDEYALEKEGEFGKSECWYVIDASKDAKLILGTKDGITKEIFKEKAEKKEFLDMFNIVSVKKGDLINIKPGLIHASLEGSILICEPQQNSDTTYRIYDFDRLVDGKLRELHIDKAIDVITFDKKPDISTEENRKKIIENSTEIQKLIKNQYFSVEKIKISEKYIDKIDENFKVYSVLEGKGNILSNGEKYEAKKGDTYFIPAKLEVELIGNMEILKSNAN